MNESFAEMSAAYRKTYDTGLSALLSRIWGGHLHMGHFRAAGEPLLDAQMRANRLMADAAGLVSGHKIIEVACGIGGTARFLAREYGVKVTATNITEAQLAEAREITVAEGLSKLIEFTFADYHQLPFPDGSFNAWWCQEALLYSIDKRRVLEEAMRTLRPTGVLVVSDLLLARSVTGRERQEFMSALKAPGMWAFEDWTALLTDLPLAVMLCEDWSRHTEPTFQQVLNSLLDVSEEFIPRIGEEAVRGTLERVTMQLTAAREGKLGWGVFVLRRP